MGATKIATIYQNQPGTNRPMSQDFGPGAVVCGQSIYETSTTKKARIGERLAVGDRVFRYALNGAGTILAGQVAMSPTLGGADTTLQTTRPVAVAAAIGDVRIYTTALTTAQVAGLYEDGLVSIFDASQSSAFLYRIKTNSALATSGVVSYLELYDGVHIALTTSDQLEFITNPFRKVVVRDSASAQTGGLAGVPPIDVTAGLYFWLQTFGPCSVIPYAALDFDESVNASKDSAGDVQKYSVGTITNLLGEVMAIGTAAESAIINLHLFA